MKKCLFLWILLCSIYLPLALGENSSKKPEEPEDNRYPYFVTAAVYPLDKGLLEFIILPEYDFAPDDNDLYMLDQVSYGITDSLQIYVNIVPYIIHQDFFKKTSGFGDSDIGYQYSWMYINHSTLSTALLFNIHLPTGDINRDLTDGFIRYEPSFLVAKDVVYTKWRTQFFAQIGMSFVHRFKKHQDILNDAPAAHSFIINTGIAQRSEKLNFSLEFNWEMNTWNNAGERNDIYVTPGVYAQLNDYVAVGLGIPIGLSSHAYRYAIMGNLLVDIETSAHKNKKKEDESKVLKPFAKKHPLLR